MEQEEEHRALISCAQHLSKNYFIYLGEERVKGKVAEVLYKFSEPKINWKHGLVFQNKEFQKYNRAHGACECWGCVKAQGAPWREVSPCDSL